MFLHNDYLRCVDVNNGFWTVDMTFDSKVKVKKYLKAVNMGCITNIFRYIGGSYLAD